MNKLKTIGILILLTLAVPMVSAAGEDISVSGASYTLVVPQSPEPLKIITTEKSTFTSPVTTSIDVLITSLDGQGILKHETRQITLEPNVVDFQVFDFTGVTIEGGYDVLITSPALEGETLLTNNVYEFNINVPHSYADYLDDGWLWMHHDIILSSYIKPTALHLGLKGSPQTVTFYISIINCGTYTEQNIELKIIEQRTGKVLYQNPQIITLIPGKTRMPGAPTYYYEVVVPVDQLSGYDCKTAKGWQNEIYVITAKQQAYSLDYDPSNNVNNVVMKVKPHCVGV